jgi:hypothetical protein
VLAKAFANYNRDTEGKGVKVNTLIKSFGQTQNLNLRFIFRLLNFIDTNTNYFIEEDG